MIKTAVQGTINAGEDAVFDITVTNTGTGTATGVTLSDPLPSAVSGDWVVSGDDAGSCQVNGVSPNQTLDCDFGDIDAAPGDNVRTVTVTAPTDFDNCATLDNEATASSTNAPDASDDASINCQKPNLTVDKTPDAQNINAGEDVVFDITVTNNGPGVAKSVKLVDTLPTGVIDDEWNVSGPDAGACNGNPVPGGALDCDFGDLGDDVSKTIKLTAKTDFENCEVYDNTATASAANAGEPATRRPGHLPKARPDHHQDPERPEHQRRR